MKVSKQSILPMHSPTCDIQEQNAFVHHHFEKLRRTQQPCGVELPMAHSRHFLQIMQQPSR
jgi:hypothetical protein